MRLALLATLLLAPHLAAHADTIDDFTLTGGGHIITYSLPATSSYPDFSLFNFFSESAPATIDGVSGYTASGQYNLIGPFFPTMILSVPNSIFGVPALNLYGSHLANFTTVPANNPYPYLPYDIVPTFIPGTYTLQTRSFTLPTQTVNYTLTINPQTTTPVPEPSTLTLLGTGVLTLFASARRISRRRDHTSQARSPGAPFIAPLL